jgi:hypothetical protein
MLLTGNSLARRLAVVVVALSGAVACASARPEGEPTAPAAPDAALEAATRRWQGARCRLTLPLEVRRQADEWTTSGPVYVAKDEGGGHEFYFQLLVESRETLGAAFEGDLLRADTPLVAEGWRFKDAESQKGPYLELRFADQTARARVEFRGVRQFNFDDFPLSRLGEVEDYCRQTLFKVEAATGEPLPAAVARPAAPAPVALPPPAAPPPPVAAPQAPAPHSSAPRSASVRGTLELVRVAVAPATVPRGGDAELAVVYSVGGLSPGETLEVLERREVLRGADLILSTEDRHERPAATFTSAKPLRFSFDAAPGSYVLRVVVEGGGSHIEGTAPFEIR